MGLTVELEVRYLEDFEGDTARSLCLGVPELLLKEANHLQQAFRKAKWSVYRRWWPRLCLAQPLKKPVR